MASDLSGTRSEARHPGVEEPEVVVVAHDPRWPERFAREALVVASAFRDRPVKIVHLGSTAVQGLAAKPIVDLLAGSRDGLLPSAGELEALAAAGYEYLGEDGRRPGRWFWRRRGPASFNLSLVRFMGPLWQDNLSMRDYLREHPGEVEAYAAVKREGVRRSPGSLLGYQDHKRTFVDALRVRAREWAEARSRAREPEP